MQGQKIVIANAIPRDGILGVSMGRACNRAGRGPGTHSMPAAANNGVCCSRDGTLQVTMRASSGARFLNEAWPLRCTRTWLLQRRCSYDNSHLLHRASSPATPFPAPTRTSTPTPSSRRRPRRRPTHPTSPPTAPPRRRPRPSLCLLARSWHRARPMWWCSKARTQPLSCLLPTTQRARRAPRTTRHLRARSLSGRPVHSNAPPALQGMRWQARAISGLRVSPTRTEVGGLRAGGLWGGRAP
jgi:hypothetical protein